MVIENRETRFHLVHPKCGDFTFRWRIQYKKSARSNPSKSGISKLELTNTLNNWIADPDDYLDWLLIRYVLKPMYICDSEHEDFWLRRCLTIDEKIEDWDIVILYTIYDKIKDIYWYQSYIKNKHTHLYSGRTITKLNNKLKLNNIRQLSQNPTYIVEWTKLSAIQPFWVELKNILNS
jgi:hypothetical protein